MAKKKIDGNYWCKACGKSTDIMAWRKTVVPRVRICPNCGCLVDVSVNNVIEEAEVMPIEAQRGYKDLVQGVPPMKPKAPKK